MLYALMIEDFFQVPVKKGFIVYVRSQNLIKEVPITEGLRNEVTLMIKSIYDICQTGFYPKGTSQAARCIDCCYRRICDHKVK